jgi:hypothetical protein
VRLLAEVATRNIAGQTRCAILLDWSPAETRIEHNGSAYSRTAPIQSAQGGRPRYAAEPARNRPGVASRQSRMEKYACLKHRYGERGRRFTYSDGCWLVTLTRAPEQAAATRALEWLRNLLASRGIPTRQPNIPRVGFQATETPAFARLIPRATMRCSRAG